MSKKIIGLLSLMTVLGVFFVPVFVLAQPDVTLVPSATEPPDIKVDNLLRDVISWLFGFIIVVVVLMTMISAYLFITAGGSPEQVVKARNFLMYALIGLAVAVLARGLVALVLDLLWST